MKRKPLRDVVFTNTGVRIFNHHADHNFADSYTPSKPSRERLARVINTAVADRAASVSVFPDRDHAGFHVVFVVNKRVYIE